MSQPLPQPSLGLQHDQSGLHEGVQGIDQGRIDGGLEQEGVGAGVQPLIEEGRAEGVSLGAVVVRDGLAGALRLGIAVGVALSGGTKR